MKKLFSLVLVLVLCMGFTTTISAANPIVTVNPGDTQANRDVADIYAIVSNETATVYSVDITWGDLEFTYSTNKGTWNPDTLTYSDPVAGAWSVATPGTDDVVSITNRSNAGITAGLIMAPYSGLTFKCNAGTAATGVTYRDSQGTVQPNSELQYIDLISADTGADTGAAVTGSFKIVVTGTPSAGAYTTKTKVAEAGVVITALATN